MFHTGPKLDFDDILIVPQFSDITSRRQVEVITTIKGKWGATITGVPIVAANMDGVGTFSMNRSLSKHGLFTAITKQKTVNDWKAEFLSLSNMTQTDNSPEYMKIVDKLFITIGMSDEELLKATQIVYHMKKNFGNVTPKIVIDVANGHMNPFYDFIAKVREAIPDAFIMAGTVATAEATQRILESGADLSRVGIGTGAVCTTRQIAGVGYPQASAILENYGVADLENGGVVCDGGCAYPGDFAKAFGLGAKMIVAGSVFAGHDESEQDIHAGKVTFYGMSSHVAQKKHGQLKDYRASEGRIVQIPYKGSVEGTVQEILGGIRSACAYIGAKNISEMDEKAVFIQVNRQLNKSLERYTV